MKKTIILMIILLLVASVSLFSSRKAMQELYIKAVSEKDPALKIERLKEYEKLYGQNKDKFLTFVYIHLADTSYQVKNYEETVKYGEIALGYEDLDPVNKLRLYSILAGSYYSAQKDLQKAYDYAGSMIDFAKGLMEKAKNSGQDEKEVETFIENYQKYYIAPGYRMQAVILSNRGKDNPDSIKEAAQKAVAAYMADKSKNSARVVLSLAGNLLKANSLDDAAAVVEKIFDESNPDRRFANFLGTIHYKKGDKDKAVRYFEMAYQGDKKVNTAMKIGQLVHKQDIDKGIRYFADAFVLSDSDEESNAFKYLRELYNRKTKDLPPKEKEKGFQEIITAAKVRLGVSGGIGDAMEKAGITTQ